MRHATALLIASLGLAACATTQGTEPGDAQADQQRSAVLFVERQATGAQGNAAHVGARFVQYTGIDPLVLPDLLGTPHVPSGALGCVERGEAAVDTSGGVAEARLLDVGPLEVRAGARVLQLEPRSFPDLWNVVSGVIYGTDDELPLGVWRFSAPGNPRSRVGAFEIETAAPEDLAGVTLAEQPFGPGGAVFVPRRPFAIRWVRGERDDSVVATFEGAGTEHARTVVCTARDEGALEIDGAWVDRIADLTRGGGVVTVHRIRTRAFTVPSLDSGLVVFDLSVRGSTRGE